jgi:uncharacterized protein YeaC (DUF1315 family)
MTTAQLKSIFNNEFGLGKWPDKYEVDHETYANVCQAIFNWLVETGNAQNYPCLEQDKEAISLGPNNGIMFKNVELILSRKQ